MSNFKELIENAKKLSKEKFLEFAKGIYNADSELFEHLWQVPIISSNENEKLISSKLSSKTYDETLEILDDCIQDELGDSEAAFVTFDKLYDYFSDKEIAEYRRRIQDGTIKEPINAFIVYNEALLNGDFKDLMEKGSGKKSQIELENIFVNHISSIFTHELCHLNSNIMLCDTKEPDLDEYVNGAESPAPLTYDIFQSFEFLENNNNEVFIDTFSQMIHNYEEGNSIEDCLYKIIKARNGKSQYNTMDDRIVLSLYTLFPEELTEFAMFGAYDQVRINTFQQKLDSIFGDKPNNSTNTQKMNLIGKYFNDMDKNSLSEEQRRLKIEMLEMLGIQNINKEISFKDVQELANSPEAMYELKNSITNLKSAIKSQTTKKHDKEIL